MNFWGFFRKSWTLPEIIEVFEDKAKEIRINVENNDLVIEVIIDENIVRKFREHSIGLERVFYEE